MAYESSEVSLVDVLTNAFIVSMILLCIVATTMGESSGDTLNSIMLEAGINEIITSKLTSKQKTEKDPPVFTLSIALPNYDTNGLLELSTQDLSQYKNDQFMIMKGAYEKNKWLVVRNGDSLKGTWSMSLSNTNLLAKDSITILSTIGTQSILRKIPYIPGRTDLIKIQEPVISGEDILVYGSSIISYDETKQ